MSKLEEIKTMATLEVNRNMVEANTVANMVVAINNKEMTIKKEEMTISQDPLLRV